MNTKTFFNLRLWSFIFMFLFGSTVVTKADDKLPEQDKDDPVKLENPMSVQYLRKNLRKSSPRLILTPSIEKKLKQKLKTDPVVQNMYKAIQLNAQKIQTEPLLSGV